METVKEILDKITDTWNAYFLEYKFFQSHINFTEDIKTNYYGDILSYFDNTLNLLSEINIEKKFGKSVFQSIGALQIIYAQQDLIDELLYIFKLTKSEKNDKEPNRKIRNELIGHPIRKKPIGNELISSVFFGNYFGNGLIHYVLYSRENNFLGKEYTYKLSDVIDRHKTYLEKYILIIWNKIKTLLKKFENNITKIKNLLNSIDFPKLIKLVEQQYENIWNCDYLFKPAILISCFERQNEHSRYQNSVTWFKLILERHLNDTLKSITELLLPKSNLVSELFPKIKIKFVNSKNKSNIVIDPKNIRYEFSKLFEKHQIFDTDYFKDKFRDDNSVVEELNNMEKNMNNDLEYYSSYYYLSSILKDKGYSI